MKVGFEHELKVIYITKNNFLAESSIWPMFFLTSALDLKINE